jgi:hypothetical protein
MQPSSRQQVQSPVPLRQQRRQQRRQLQQLIQLRRRPPPPLPPIPQQQEEQQAPQTRLPLLSQPQWLPRWPAAMAAAAVQRWTTCCPPEAPRFASRGPPLDMQRQRQCLRPQGQPRAAAAPA